MSEFKPINKTCQKSFLLWPTKCSLRRPKHWPCRAQNGPDADQSVTRLGRSLTAMCLNCLPLAFKLQPLSHLLRSGITASPPSPFTHTHTCARTPPKHIMRQSHLLLNPHWVYLWSVRPRCAIFGSRSFNLFPWFGDNNNNCAVGAALKLADTSSGVIAQPSHPKVPLLCSHAFTSSSFAVHWHKGCRSSSSFSFPFFQLIQIRCLKTNLVWIVMPQRRVYNLLIQRHNRKRSGSEFKMN